MLTQENFLNLLNGVRSLNYEMPPEVRSFVDFAETYETTLFERTAQANKRAMVERESARQIQQRADSLSQRISSIETAKENIEKQYYLAKFQKIGLQVMRKNLQDKNFMHSVVREGQLFKICDITQDLNKTIGVSRGLLREVETSNRNWNEAVDLSNRVNKALQTTKVSLVEQNGQLKTLNGDLTAANLEIERLQGELTIANGELTAAGNELAATNSELERLNTFSFNPMNWSSGQWVSFSVGCIVGEQLLEQVTDFKPVRRGVRRCVRRIFKRTQPKKSNSLPAELLPEVTQNFTSTSIGVETVHVQPPCPIEVGGPG